MKYVQIKKEKIKRNSAGDLTDLFTAAAKIEMSTHQKYRQFSFKKLKNINKSESNQLRKV